jgi:hypothetical protein
MKYLKATHNRPILHGEWVIPATRDAGAWEVSDDEYEEALKDQRFSALLSQGAMVVLDNAPMQTVADYKKAYDDLQTEALAEIAKLKARIAELESKTSKDSAP